MVTIRLTMIVQAHTRPRTHYTKERNQLSKGRKRQ